MKDRQTEPAAAQPSVFIISPVLHWLAMPAIVFLRSGFGYAFLRPRVIFLVSVYVSALFAVYAWLEQGAWAKYWALVLYSLGASILYLLQLSFTVGRETRGTGKHDAYGGTSHLLRVPGLDHLRANGGFVMALQLWMEPFFILIVATALRAFVGETRLSMWLLIVAVAMWFKAFINFWYGRRSEKKHSDIIEDAEERMPGTGGQREVPLPNAAGRKPRTKRQPQSGAEAMSPEEIRHAEVLRLMPPFTLEQAEQNYRALIKTCHPDPNNPSAENTRKTAELNEAIAYLREKLGG